MGTCIEKEKWTFVVMDRRVKMILCSVPVLAVSLERMESETKMGAIYTYCYSVPYLIRHHISQIQAMALNSVAC